VTDTNPLDYDPVTRTLAAYDGNSPRTKVPNFLLNFDAVDGGGQKVKDGKDRLFGDLGHDWLVGGTQNDRLFGGMGDDVLNADDNHDGQGGLNNAPDAPLFADRDFAFGGGGQDALIANTGGDRLFDWTGNFNSYFVPFSSFGSPTVERSHSPHIQGFLLALGKESGSDQTLAEPDGELGLVTSKDPQWGDQHGPGRDAAKGHIPGVQRDTKGGPEDDRGQNLRATGTPPGKAGSVSPITEELLASVAAEAVRRWSALGAAVRVEGVSFLIMDLPGRTLGRAGPSSVLVDPTAAGYGWFMDTTPPDDAEFRGRPAGGRLLASRSGPAFGRMDLLTVVMHELGHVLGLEDLGAAGHAHELMAATLAAGVRRLPAPAELPPSHRPHSRMTGAAGVRLPAGRPGDRRTGDLPGTGALAGPQLPLLSPHLLATIAGTRPEFAPARESVPAAPHGGTSHLGDRQAVDMVFAPGPAEGAWPGPPLLRRHEPEGNLALLMALLQDASAADLLRFWEERR
jgi:hypothetical protein